MKNRRQNIVRKGKLFKAAEEIRDGVVAYNESKMHDQYVSSLVKTWDLSALTSEGKVLHICVKAIKDFYSKMYMKKDRRTPKKCTYNFIINRFLHMYEKHGDKVKDSLIFGLFHNMLETLSGTTSHAKDEKTMNFFMMLHSISPQAFNAA